MGCADEALRQLVGDVVVLGQDLAGEVEGDCLGAVLGHDGPQPGRDGVERFVPTHPVVRAGHVALQRMQHAAAESQRLAERRTLGAEPPAIGGMLRLARDGGAAPPVRRREHATANPAIGAGGANRGRGERSVVAHQAAFPMQ
ncbi:hypothetical protein D3C87_1641540 [compost metagenome]